MEKTILSRISKQQGRNWEYSLKIPPEIIVRAKINDIENSQ